MTAPSYTTDLNDITDAESGTWGEITGYTQGGTPSVNDNDFFIQGQACTSQSTSNKTGLVVSMYFDYGSDLSGSFGAGDCIFFWQGLMAPNAMDTVANGGLRLGVGSGIGDFEMWISGGKDYGRNPYGGWANIAIDPTYNSSTGDYTIGTPTGAYRYFASHLNLLSAISKGNPHVIDAIRYGRGELIIEYGETADYGTFAGLATENDKNVTSYYNRWGLFQAEGIGYLWKGLMSFGNATNACDFRDSNRNITIDDCPRTYAAFNKIEINNASSRVDWTGINITTANESGLSVGSFEMKADATVNLINCVFTGMSTFIFDSNATLDTVTFRRCGLVTQAGADIDDCIFDEPSGAIALTADAPDDIDGCTFNSDGTGHAIEIAPVGAGPFTFTLTGCNFNDYAASDGSTGNEALLIHPATNSANITLYTSGGSTPSIMEHASYTGTFTLIPDPVDVYVKAITATGVEVQNARVLLRAKDGTGPFPYNVTVTIVNSGTLATVSHGTHGMATGDKVQISGGNLAANRGVFTITYIDAGSYSYTMGSTPGSSPTGTIKCTFVALAGLTDVNGEIETSRVYSSDQPVIGWARKSTSTPLYKTAPLVGTIDDIIGFTGTGVLIIDE